MLSKLCIDLGDLNWYTLNKAFIHLYYKNINWAYYRYNSGNNDITTFKISLTPVAINRIPHWGIYSTLPIFILDLPKNG